MKLSVYEPNEMKQLSKESLFRIPDIVSAKVSPNGQYIAFVGGDGASASNVTIAPVKSQFLPFQLTSFDAPEIIQFFWSGDSRNILVLKDEKGTGQLQLHGFDVQTKEHLWHTGHLEGVQASIIKVSSTKSEAVIGLREGCSCFHDLYLLDLKSGSLSLIFQNEQYAKFLFSDSLNLILKVKIIADGRWLVLLKDDQVFLELSPDEAMQFELLSYDSQMGDVYFLDTRFSNTSQLTRKSSNKPYDEKMLGGSEYSDVDEVLLFEGLPKAYATYYTHKEWHVLDPKYSKDMVFLTQEMGEAFEIVSQCRKGKLWIVRSSVPNLGLRFCVYDREAMIIRSISPHNPVSPGHYAHMYELLVTARDGLQLVCYYSLPRERDRGGWVDAPIPLVVVPHGGPFKVRDKFEFNPFHQWLTSCGYAVLSVNFRLSSGFGKQFVREGNGEWGGKAHLDVIDAVEACILKGIADRERLAILGSSYGGYEVLAALVFSPTLFCCGVAISGISNLRTVLENVPEYWEFTSSPLSDHKRFYTRQAFVRSMGGDPEDEEGADYLERCSPLNYLERIQAPLLLVHGENDHVVKESESKQIFDSLKKRGKRVTYLLFSDEGHRFAGFENKLKYLSEAESFLSKHLKEERKASDSTGCAFS